MCVQWDSLKCVCRVAAAANEDDEGNDDDDFSFS